MCSIVHDGVGWFLWLRWTLLFWGSIFSTGKDLTLQRSQQPRERWHLRPLLVPPNCGNATWHRPCGNGGSQHGSKWYVLQLSVNSWHVEPGTWDEQLCQKMPEGGYIIIWYMICELYMIRGIWYMIYIYIWYDMNFTDLTYNLSIEPWYASKFIDTTPSLGICSISMAYLAVPCYLGCSVCTPTGRLWKSWLNLGLNDIMTYSIAGTVGSSSEKCKMWYHII